jgi:TDG/mug DNA glycosylase family protein
MTKTTRCYSFPPIARPSAKILILGSIPGQASLDLNQYYAHPRNAFWPIMHQLFDVNPQLEYSQRCELLTSHHIAVWDVLKACDRQGSLDSNIDSSTIEENDFTRFFKTHPAIKQVFFNGAKAEQTYRRYVLKTLDASWQILPLVKLPSTSPAHATLNVQNKIDLWGEAILENRN